MKKWIAIYVIGALFTNSYVREYRYDEWVKKSEKYHSARMSDDASSFCAILATVGWPLYVAVSITDVIVSTKVKVEKPEILK